MRLYSLLQKAHYLCLWCLTVLFLCYPAVGSALYVAMSKQVEPYEKNVYGKKPERPSRSVAKRKAKKLSSYRDFRMGPGRSSRSFGQYSLEDERFNPEEYDMSGRKKRAKQEKLTEEPDRFTGDMDEYGRKVRQEPQQELTDEESSQAEDRFFTELDESGRVLREENTEEDVLTADDDDEYIEYEDETIQAENAEQYDEKEVVDAEEEEA